MFATVIINCSTIFLSNILFNSQFFSFAINIEFLPSSLTDCTHQFRTYYLLLHLYIIFILCFTSLQVVNRSSQPHHENLQEHHHHQPLHFHSHLHTVNLHFYSLQLHVNRQRTSPAPYHELEGHALRRNGEGNVSLCQLLHSSPQIHKNHGH